MIWAQRSLKALCNREKRKKHLFKTNFAYLTIKIIFSTILSLTVYLEMEEVEMILQLVFWSVCNQGFWIQAYVAVLRWVMEKWT